MYPLAQDIINNNDIDNLIDWLKTYPRLTKGSLTVEFENIWSKWIGTKHSVYVNSGSSANLLMLYSLFLSMNLKLGDKVVVPAISWATDLSPVIQLGLQPILCDCNLENLSVDVTELRKIFENDKPKALILVSVLGLVPNMEEIVSLCDQHNVILLEDVCESLGSKFHGKNLGTFGKMSSFSLYYGHHISTIEGGMICTNDDDFADILRSIRNHGWDRDWSFDKQEEFRSKYDVLEFDRMYKFYYPGFNVRSTDLQAKLGLRQIQKLDSVCQIRERNFKEYLKCFKTCDMWLPQYDENNTYVSNFCFPIIHKNKNKIYKSLKENNIESRPLICGSMGRQPMYYDRFGKCDLKNADLIDEIGLYIPNNQSLTTDDVRFIASIVIKAMEEN